jgi:hypothetical protein
MGACLSVAAVVGDDMRAESWWAQVFAAGVAGWRQQQSRADEEGLLVL